MFFLGRFFIDYVRMFLVDKIPSIENRVQSEKPTPDSFIPPSRFRVTPNYLVRSHWWRMQALGGRVTQG